METTIWHNPRCSKSRQTLALLGEHGVEPRVRRYLDDPPTTDELEVVLEMLGIEPRELMRRGEVVYRELGLADVNTPMPLVEAMASHPKLIERPIVIRDGRAVIGRPPERVLELL